MAPNNGGYGPIGPVPDQTDGVVRLHLPEGFEYRSFTPTGTPMSDGVLTPGRHDGMAAFSAGPSRYRLVRNHEVNGPVGAFGNAAKAYDGKAGGGTITLEVNQHATKVESWVSCNGTQMNCAGGATPWGSWLTCEETVNGPDVGNDFTGGNNSLLEQKHGYVFEVPSSWNAGEYVKPVPIRSAGRFAHEAVDIDARTGILYMTEDNFDFPSGFYRYTAPENPLTAKRLTDGGTLEMLKIEGTSNAVLDKGQTPGVTYGVEWVTIDDPDPTFAPGTTNNQAIVAIGDQGRAKGAATSAASRASSPTRARSTSSPPRAVTRLPASRPRPATATASASCGSTTRAQGTLTLLFESPSRTVLELPDNICISPRKCSLLCEDGPTENLLRGITPDGEIFDFALNAIAGRGQEEFAGSTFTPDGKVLFVNIQASSGITFAIWGPWRRGVL